MTTGNHRKTHPKHLGLALIALGLVFISFSAILLSGSGDGPAEDSQLPNETSDQATIRNYSEDIAQAETDELEDIKRELDSEIEGTSDENRLQELKQVRVEACVQLSDIACIQSFIDELSDEETQLRFAYLEQVAKIYAEQGNNQAAIDAYQTIIDELQTIENVEEETIAYFTELQEALR